MTQRCVLTLLLTHKHDTATRAHPAVIADDEISSLSRRQREPPGARVGRDADQRGTQATVITVVVLLQHAKYT